MDTHFRLSVFIIKVMGRDQINHLGIIYSAKHLEDRRRKRETTENENQDSNRRQQKRIFQGESCERLESHQDGTIYSLT